MKINKTPLGWEIIVENSEEEPHLEWLIDRLQLQTIEDIEKGLGAATRQARAGQRERREEWGHTLIPLVTE